MTGTTPATRMLRIASDIGGTFTDIAAFDERTGRLHLGKTLSTPHSLLEGIKTGIRKAGVNLADADFFVHGSTIVINSLLERKGARTALILTEGFRDIYEMGRGNRPDAYNLFFTKHKPLVKRAWRFVVRERMLAGGAVRTALDEASVLEVCERLRDEDISAVGILLLHSYANPAHEIRVKQIVQEQLPGIFVTASHELSQEYREFERCSTVAANAYVGPRVTSYLDGIERELDRESFRGPFFVLQSSGGLIDIANAKKHCVRLLESGPAGGIIGVKALCDVLGLENAIGIDMGGTTAKAGVIHQGEALTTTKAMVGGYAHALPIQTSMIDIFEVGTGGGSIAYVNEAGALRVGPESAGAAPGPASYALGGVEPTVTDANLVLGRLADDRFLGGDMRLDTEAARIALISRVGKPLGLTLEAAAFGVLAIATNAMATAVRTIATSRGVDAGAFDLIAYGGAGPLLASAVMRELGMRSVIVPRAPGHFSAFGMLFADLRHDYVHTRISHLETTSFPDMEAIFEEDERRGHEALAAAGVQLESVLVQRVLEMRYVGQEHAVTVSIPSELIRKQDRDAIKERFDRQHP
ncbi:MAG: hydantoinase/oxoprolinase family protein, partial [Pseudorhodoplanes sp.]